MGLSLSPAPFRVYQMELISNIPGEEKVPCGFGGGTQKWFWVHSYNIDGI